ncbi:MAG: DMT family transporter [Sporomusaceae bacterium]|nr:DMT family transporter [Sporomusaceae bacterium]
MLSGKLVSLLTAALSGLLMAVQGSLNTALSKTIGLMEMAFVVNASGALALAAALFLFRAGSGDFSLLGQAPWYSFGGGIIGVAIIYLVAASIPAVGMCNATTAIIVGQVLTAILIDYCGAFGLHKQQIGWEQFAGLALLAAGAKLLMR